MKDHLHRVEDSIASTALFAMALLPVIAVFLRQFFHTGIPGSTSYVQNLTLWVGFLGGAIATRNKSHLSLSTAADYLPKRFKRKVLLIRGFVSTAVCTGLFWASLRLVMAEYESSIKIAGWLPLWMIEAIMPLGFAVMTYRFALTYPEGRLNRFISLMGILAAALIGLLLSPYISVIAIPLIIVLILSGLLGVPIFIVLGGLALILFFSNDVPVAAIPVETYRIVASPIIPTIPLFTLAGYILAEGGASRRLVKLFRALFGWMPGGIAVASILVCTFFTTFTGASGATILALGGLLLPVLIKSGYRKNFSIGLLTSTGSLGLLFPPSLPMILYGVFSHTPITDLFIAGLLPGMLLVAFIVIFTLREAIKTGISRSSFSASEIKSSIWESKWELGIPVVVIFGIFGGYFTLVEAGATTAVYTIIIECIIYRDIHITKDLPAILLKCTGLMGGVIIIMGVAMGLSGYIVDAEIPVKVSVWVRENIDSKYTFLFLLNIALLITGCLMDIFSALVVVVPLVLPLGAAFGIDPVHLGIIFIANLELGYLTPPVGMNLFLSSYRFEEPLSRIYRNTFPFLILRFLAVILITYMPFMTTGVLDFFKR